MPEMVLPEHRKKVAMFVAEADEPPPLLHSSMALQYRKRVQQLYESFQDDEDEKRIRQPHHPLRESRLAKGG